MAVSEFLEDLVSHLPPLQLLQLVGYTEYLEIIVDVDDDWQKDMLRWSGKFDPEEFDAGKATKLMQRGLPNWRNML